MINLSKINPSKITASVKPPNTRSMKVAAPKVKKLRLSPIEAAQIRAKASRTVDMYSK